ncbi:MAG: methyl-accepting chemotaxis protein [Spirochaeta sp.]|nr:methyl-accepting chemotaxis protein [Spirochaeta sp.]
MRSIGQRIIITVALAILLVEAIILGFSTFSQRQTLINRYLFQASLVSQTLDGVTRGDGGGGDGGNNQLNLFNEATERLAGRGVRQIRTSTGPGVETWAEGPYGGRYQIDDDRLKYYANGIVIHTDISALSDELWSYAFRIAGLVVVIVGFVTIVVYLLLRPQLVIPLRRLHQRINGISEGDADLTERIPLQRNDEIGLISESFNNFSDHLLSIIVVIKSRAQELITNAERLAGESHNAEENVFANGQAVQDMQDGVAHLDKSLQDSAESVRHITSSIAELTTSVGRQAGAVSDSIAAVEEMDASIRSLDGIAKENKTLTDHLVSMANTAGEQIRESVSAIGTVETSTQDMLEMIDVINTVAEQTNLLAMNAAIEAAHAGEAGKGFAVVSDEIRKLSVLSSENAGTINKTLREDIARIHEAGEINRSAGEAFDRIVDSVQDVARAMSEMMAGLDEQAYASKEIVRSISEIREVTDTVQRESERINTDSETINTSIETLAASASKLNAQAQSVIERISTISASISAVNEIVGNNKERMAALAQEVAQFKTD